MDSKDLIRTGRLSAAREQLVKEIKSSPADLGKRTLLFQVLSFCGEWGKAERHLDTISVQDTKKETGVQVYKNLLRAEREREEVLKLKRRPSFLPKTPPYLERYLEAWARIRSQDIDEAEKVLASLEAEIHAVSGTVDGKNFSGFRDTDSYLSPFLEAIVHERYLWIPFADIRELSISPPKSLFDLLWIQARITTWEGLTVGSYLPVLYAESSLHEDDKVKLGRMTEWVSLGGPFFKGMGQHVFQVGEEDKPLLEMREVLFQFSGVGKP